MIERVTAVNPNRSAVAGETTTSAPPISSSAATCPMVKPIRDPLAASSSITSPTTAPRNAADVAPSTTWPAAIAADVSGDIKRTAASGASTVKPIGMKNPAGAVWTAAVPRVIRVIGIIADRPGTATPPADDAARAAARSTEGLSSDS